MFLYVKRMKAYLISRSFEYQISFTVNAVHKNTKTNRTTKVNTKFVTEGNRTTNLQRRLA